MFAAARSLRDRAALLRTLATLDRRTSTPVAAVLVLGGVAAVLTMIGERSLLFLISGDIITPALMIVAVLVGRRRGRTGKISFRSPGYPVLPLIGLAILAAFLSADIMDGTARVSLMILITVAFAAAFVKRPIRAKT